MSQIESLLMPGVYKHFSPRFEKIVYVLAIIIALIYAGVDYFILTSFFTPKFRVIAGLAYIFPLTVLFVTGTLYFTKARRPIQLLNYNIAGLTTFLVFHFFPFYFEKTDDLKILSLFLLFQLILCGTYIVAQILVLLSFSLKTLQPIQGTGILYSVKPSKVNRPGRVWLILFTSSVPTLRKIYVAIS